jgi:hypothetical protein
MILFIFILGVVGAFYFDKTSHFLIACSVLSLILAFWNGSKWALKTENTDIPKQNKDNAVAAAFINAFFVGAFLTAGLGGLARLMFK